MSRVLIIEDEPVLARLLQLLVEVEGYETIVADDGIRGFAAAQRQAPDAILMDLMMPVMDGYGTLEALRTDERTADIPVVVLSAIASDAARQRCIDSGAVAIVQAVRQRTPPRNSRRRLGLTPQGNRTIRDARLTTALPAIGPTSEKLSTEARTATDMP